MTADPLLLTIRQALNILVSCDLRSVDLEHEYGTGCRRCKALAACDALEARMKEFAEPFCVRQGLSNDEMAQYVGAGTRMTDREIRQRLTAAARMRDEGHPMRVLLEDAAAALEEAERDDLRTVEEAARATVKEAGCYSNGIPQSSTARALYDALAALDARREVLGRYPKAPA